jgi:hypothetical protein
VTDEERRRIEAEARLDAKWEARLESVEKRLEEIGAALTWGVRAIWGVAVYLAVKLFEFIANGGSLK